MDLKPPRFRTTQQKELWADKELHRCLRSSWYLATEFLGYEWGTITNQEFPQGEPRGLTERVHKPIMDWYDRNKACKRIGIWMARRRHKTTMVITWLLQEVLMDPSRSHRYWHDSNDLAADFVREAGSHFSNNEKLRALDPFGRHEGRLYHVLPKTKGASRWIKFGKGESQFRLTIPWRRFGVGSRAATLRAQGVRSAVTGAHINGTAWFDDIISEDTIRNSELQKVADFYRHTAVPVVDSMRFRCTGTPWSDWSIYQEWQKDKRWSTIVLPGAISETDEEYKAKFREAA